MNIPTPAVVRTAHQAQVVREARTPVYTTETPKGVVRQHKEIVEVAFPDGGRYRSVMVTSEVGAFIDSLVGQEVSDIDHAASCWCFVQEA